MRVGVIARLNEEEVERLLARTRIDVYRAEVGPWAGHLALAMLCPFVFPMLVPIVPTPSVGQHLILLCTCTLAALLVSVLFGMILIGPMHLNDLLYGGYVARARTHLGEDFWTTDYKDGRLQAAFGYRTYTGLLKASDGAFVLRSTYADWWVHIAPEFGGGPGERTAFVLTDCDGRTARVKPDEDVVLDVVSKCMSVTQIPPECLVPHLSVAS